MGRKKKEQQQESLKQNPVNETPEDSDSAEYGEMPDQSEQIVQTGSVTVTKAKHVIHCLTIVGQIEGHYILPPQNKTTKYEHVIPQLVAIEQDPSIEGLMIILNTVGGDVEAGLAIAELISGMKKPTVSLVLGGGHSIGVPLACSARQSFIAPSASMTVHPVRMNGLVLGVPQTLSYFDRMQERIVRFVTDNSKISSKDFRRLMMNTGELVTVSYTGRRKGGGGGAHRPSGRLKRGHRLPLRDDRRRGRRQKDSPKSSQRPPHRQGKRGQAEMILHSIVPVEAMQQMMADWQAQGTQQPARQTFFLSATCAVEGTVRDGQITVERIFSTNPADFLGKELYPTAPVSLSWLPRTYPFP